MLLYPEGVERVKPGGFSPDLCAQFVGGGPVTIVYCLGSIHNVRTEHRLEAYATLRLGVVSAGARR
jgi:hypothetical protein